MIFFSCNRCIDGGGYWNTRRIISPHVLDHVDDVGTSVFFVIISLFLVIAVRPRMKDCPTEDRRATRIESYRSHLVSTSVGWREREARRYQMCVQSQHCKSWGFDGDNTQGNRTEGALDSRGKGQEGLALSRMRRNSNSNNTSSRTRSRSHSISCKTSSSACRRNEGLEEDEQQGRHRLHYSALYLPDRRRRDSFV